MKKVIIRTIPGPGQPDSAAVELGQLVDDGGTPFGTTPFAEGVLAGNPRERFDYYSKGYSNGYVEYVAA